MLRTLLRWGIAVVVLASVLGGAAVEAATSPALSAVATAPASTAATPSTPAIPASNPCAAGAPTGAPFAVDINRVGLVDLDFFLAAGAPVTFYECVGTHAQELGVRSMTNGGTLTPFMGASQWNCTRLDRHFAATTTLADGQFEEWITSVRTPSCDHRFKLDLPGEIGDGQPTSIRMVDLWTIGGIDASLCLTAPQGKPQCQDVPFAAAENVATRQVRLPTRGEWGVSLAAGGYRVTGTIAVGVKSVAPPTPPPTVLATGDSTMQGVDSFLTDDLGTKAKVISDVHPGFAISADDGWAAIARTQVGEYRPRVTVISLGADEGFPMKAADGTVHQCCDSEWTAELTTRIRQIMEIYRQDGHARVFYMTIPQQQAAARVPIIDAVNVAIVDAATGLSGVLAVRMDLLFSPNGYQQDIRYGGREVSVRLPDGVHLNISGTSIEAQILAKDIGTL
jgi:hypothetical protein